MLIALGILAWIICGLASIYLAGVHDKFNGCSPTKEGGGVFLLLVVLGPLALIIVSCFILNLSTRSTENPIIKIYNLGYNREEKK